MIHHRIKFSESNFNQSLSWTLDLFPKILSNILGILANWARWSEMVVVKLPEFCLDWLITFENMLSIRVLEWQVMLVGCYIAGRWGRETWESKNSMTWLCSLLFKRLTSNSSSTKILMNKMHRWISVNDSRNNIWFFWIDSFNKDRFQFIIFIDI